MENRDVRQQPRNMAEAAVESPAARFFCHRCTQEISPVLPDYICPRCRSGFIEELAQGPQDPNEDGEEDYTPITQIGDLWSVLHYMRNPEDQSFSHYNASNQDSRDGRNVSRPGPSRRARNIRIPNRWRTDDSMRARIEGFLQPLVSSLSENAGFVTNASVPVFLNLHSNPGDYAWGRGGWNAIINQLINQLDVTGPPPLPKEKINEIPTVEICQEQVDKNLQCTVCMEDFKLSEPVRRLSCDHHFHNECIIPWLELHGTCPICRKLLNDNSQDSFSATNLPDHFMSDASTTNQESSQTTSVSDSEDLSSVSRNFNPHHLPSVYDFTDDFD